MPRLDRVVVTSIIFFVVVSVGIMTLSSFADPAAEQGEVRTSEPVLLDGPGQYADVADSYGTDPTVYNSLGKAVKLTGANDSYVRSDQSVEIATDANWTVSVWSSMNNASTNETMTVLSADEELVLTYNGSAGNWSVWVYDPGSTQSYVLNVSAPTPGGLTNIQITSNTTHVAIYRNNTAGDIKSRSSGSIASVPVNSTNCACVLEEARSTDDHLNSSQRQQLVDNPNDPLNTADRTMRIMFDQADANTQLIFYSDARLLQSNVSFVDGHQGETMDGKSLINDITGSTDYVWDDDGPRIYVVEGGELDDAPVAYVDYTYFEYGGTITTWTDSLERAINMAAIIPAILLLVVIISYLTLLRGR